MGLITKFKDLQAKSLHLVSEPSFLGSMAEGTKNRELIEACERAEMMLVEERATREAGQRNNQTRLEMIAQNQNELQKSITAIQQQLQGIINQMHMINHGGNENSREVEKMHNQALAQTIPPSTPSRFAPFRRIEFPCFNGEDPQSWIEKCDEYFKVLFTIPENKRVDLAYIYFEGDAKIWFREYLEERDTPTWDEFVAMILQKFGLNEVNSGQEVEQIDESCLFEKMSARIISEAHLIDEVFVQNFGAPSEIEVSHKVFAEITLKENMSIRMFNKVAGMEFNELKEIEISNKMDVTTFRGFKQWKIKRFNNSSTTENGEPCLGSFLDNERMAFANLFKTTNTYGNERISSDVEQIAEAEIQVRKLYCVNKAVPVLLITIRDGARSEVGIEKALEIDEQLVRVNQDTRLNYRLLDLRTVANHEMFQVQCQIKNIFIQFLLFEGLVGIHTPKLIANSSEVGLAASRLDYKGKLACLAQSPRLHKQMAICGDFSRVFGIGLVFRAGDSFAHNYLFECTGLDVEMEIKEHYLEVMDIVERLFVAMFDYLNEKCSKELEAVNKQYPFENLKYRQKTLRFTFEEGVQMLQEVGVEILPHGVNTKSEKKLGQLVPEMYNTEFYILHRYPLAVRPFYTMPYHDDLKYSNLFDVFIRVGNTHNHISEVETEIFVVLENDYKCSHDMAYEEVRRAYVEVKVGRVHTNVIYTLMSQMNHQEQPWSSKGIGSAADGGFVIWLVKETTQDTSVKPQLVRHDPWGQGSENRGSNVMNIAVGGISNVSRWMKDGKDLIWDVQNQGKGQKRNLVIGNSSINKKGTRGTWLRDCVECLLRVCYWFLN